VEWSDSAYSPACCVADRRWAVRVAGSKMTCYIDLSLVHVDSRKLNAKTVERSYIQQLSGAG